MFNQEELESIINELWPDTAPKSRPENSYAVDVARKAYHAQQMRKKYEAEERLHMDTLKALAQGKSATFGEYILVKECRAGAIDYKAIPELFDVKLEDYRKDSVSVWKLSKLEK